MPVREGGSNEVSREASGLGYEELPLASAMARKDYFRPSIDAVAMMSTGMLVLAGMNVGPANGSLAVYS